MRDASKGMAEQDPLAAVVQENLPDLHRYCARMVGSVFDAEDVVQDALAKAFSKRSDAVIENPRAWIFRIVHNTALDHLRRRSRSHALFQEEVDAATQAEPPRLEEREITGFAFRLFLRLTPLQRSCVILKDVIGYTLQEIADFLDQTLGAVKAALFRGRTALRALAIERDEAAPIQLDALETSLLQTYVDRFNARDFDALRGMLAEDVKLNLVAKSKLDGASAVGTYFGNYDRQSDWLFTIGLLDGQMVLLVRDPTEASPRYVVRIDWKQDRVFRIRDYRYARHVLADSPVGPIPAPL